MSDRIEFQMVRPPGWVHIPIDETSGSVIDAYARQAAKQALPDRRGIAENLLRDYLTSTIEQTAAAGGQDVFFPGELIDGSPVPMSIVVAKVTGPAASATRPRMEALTAFSASDSSSELRQIAGEPAIRQVADLDATVDEKGDLTSPASRRVSYVLWSTGEKPELIMFTGSMVRLPDDDDGEFLGVLEFLFDTIMSTVRFVREDVQV